MSGGCIEDTTSAPSSRSADLRPLTSVYIKFVIYGRKKMKHETIIIFLLAAILLVQGYVVSQTHQARVATEKAALRIDAATDLFKQLVIAEKVQFEAIETLFKLSGLTPVAEKAEQEFFESIIAGQPIWPVGRKLE
jgi:hypothetical protein